MLLFNFDMNIQKPSKWGNPLEALAFFPSPCFFTLQVFKQIKEVASCSPESILKGKLKCRAPDKCMDKYAQSQGLGTHRSSLSVFKHEQCGERCLRVMLLS